MVIKFSELAAAERSKRYATARRWAAKRTRDELEHAVAALFARQMAGIGQYGFDALPRRREAKALYDRTFGYALRGKVQSSNGGRNSGKQRKEDAAKWQLPCIEQARQLLDGGKSPRSIVGILAERYGRTPSQVRSVLKKAEVK